jgi:PKHD-type hydroxylase
MFFPIKPKNTPGRDTHAYWENFLSDKEIDQILSDSAWKDSYQAHVQNSEGKGVVDKKYRSTDIGWLTVRADTINLWEKVSEAFADVNSRFFQYNLTGFFEEMQLGLYKEDDRGHYTWHSDDSIGSGPVPTRKLSMAMLLSDPSEFEGGELQLRLPNDEIRTLEMKKGRAWFFPSYTQHRVTPVTKGIRKSLVVWAGGPQFK